MSDLPPPPPRLPLFQMGMPAKKASELGRLNFKEEQSYGSRPDRRLRYVLGLFVSALGLAILALLFFVIAQTRASMPTALMFGWFAGGGVLLAVGNWLRRGR